jgi:putative endonuclease
MPAAPTLVRSPRIHRDVNRGERIAARHYRLRGYRILAANVRAGGHELDLIARRGSRLVFVEVKERSRDGYGGPVAAVNREKRRRVRRAAAAWLQAHPETAALEVSFEVAAITGRTLERLEFC